MIDKRRLLLFLLVILATAFFMAPAWASLIVPEPNGGDVLARDVVVMEYQKALGGTIHISADGGSSFEYVYAGPYAFNVYQAVQDGIGVGKGTLVDSLVAMYCDSASYNLLLSYPYVQLSGADVVDGYGRLYDHANTATAKATYEHMAWALEYAFSQNTQEWYKAAQMYTWELMSDAVYGDGFDLAHGIFQVASVDRTQTLLNEVNYIYGSANGSKMASLNVPVTLLPDISGALYSDTLSGTTSYFKNSESSQEFLTLPLIANPEPGTLLLLGSGLAAALGGIAWRRRKS